MMRKLFMAVMLLIGLLTAAEFNVVLDAGGSVQRSAEAGKRLICRFDGKSAITLQRQLSGDFQTEVVLGNPHAASGGFSVRLIPENTAGATAGVTAFFLRDGYGNGNIYLSAVNREGKICYFGRDNQWSEKWGRASLLWTADQTLKISFLRRGGKLTINVQSGKYAVSTGELALPENAVFRLSVEGGNGQNGGKALLNVESVTVNQEKIDLHSTAPALPEARKYKSLPFAGRFTFPGGDGYLKLPEDFDPAKRYPLIIFFHGRGGLVGFGNFNTPDFADFARLCSERGFIVAAPAYGSDSWLNDAAEKLTLSMVDFLERELPVDGEQIFAMGCSMGGASSLLFTARHPEKIRAVCDIFGITDYREFYNNGPRFRSSLTAAFGGNPDEKPEYYAARSPVNHVDVLKTKRVMIIHGTADNVVPKQHSDTLVQQLQAAGGRVDYRIVNGVGHENRIIRGLERTVLDFFRNTVTADSRRDEPACFRVMAENPEPANDPFIPVVRGGFFRHIPASADVPWTVSAYDCNTELNANSVYPAPFPALSLDAFAARGEYTFLTFAVQTRKEVKDFRFELSGLTGDDGSRLDANRVKLFLVDSREFLSAPIPGVVPADRLFAMAIFLAAPEDGAATVYRGTLNISGGARRVTMPVNFAVLPVSLPEADIAFGAYLPGHTRDKGDAWGAKWGMNEYLSSRLPLYFRFWKSRGLNSPTLYHLSPTVIGSGAGFRQDFSVIDQVAAVMKENDLRGPMVLDTRFYARWADGAAPRPEYRGMADVELFRKSMEQLKQHAADAKWPRWLCTPEEEIGNGGEKVTFYQKYWQVLRQAVGQENEIVIDNDIGQGRKNAVDRGERDKFIRRQYNSWTEEGLAAAKRDGAEVWSYNYGWNRCAFGLLQLRLDSRGHHQWADQWMLGGEWYVTMLQDDGVVSSVKMERTHEGVNDYRTASWLRRVNPAEAARLIPQLVAGMPIQRNEFYHYITASQDRDFMLARWRMLMAGNPASVRDIAAPGNARFGIIAVETPGVIENTGKKNTTAVFLVRTPVIDGKIDGAWDAVKLGEPFRRTKNFEANARAFAATDEHYQKMISASYTAFGAAYSQDGMLLRLAVNHSTPEQVPDSGNDDGGLWKNDCVEFFFNIPGDGVYQLIVNARGNRTLFRHGSVVSSEGIAVGTLSPLNASGGYAQEILIPWERFGLQRMPEAGTVWNLNAGREYHSGKLLSSWSQVEEAFGEKHNYGTLHFGADTASALRLTRRPGLLCGKNRIDGILNPASAGKQRTLQLLDGRGQVIASADAQTDGRFSLEFFVPPAMQEQVFTLTVAGNSAVSEKFIIQAAPALVATGRREYFAMTGGEMQIAVSFLVSSESRRGNRLAASFSSSGRELHRLEAPAVLSDKAVCSFRLDGIAPGRYELVFTLADGITELPGSGTLFVNVLPSPYVKP